MKLFLFLKIYENGFQYNLREKKRRSEDQLEGIRDVHWSESEEYSLFQGYINMFITQTRYFMHSDWLKHHVAQLNENRHVFRLFLIMKVWEILSSSSEQPVKRNKSGYLLYWCVEEIESFQFSSATNVSKKWF